MPDIDYGAIASNIDGARASKHQALYLCVPECLGQTLSPLSLANDHTNVHPQDIN